MRIPAPGGWQRRLAQFAPVALAGTILAACTEQANSNPTGDDAAPNLFGEANGSIGFPHEVVTTEGLASAGLYLPIFLIAVLIFVIVEGLLLFLILRYRKRSSGDDLPEQTHGNNKLELIWTASPMVTVFVLFLVSTNVLMNDVEDRSDEHGAVVDVNSFRFGWIFDNQEPSSDDPEAATYEPVGVTDSGGGREGAPNMVLPVGEPVLIRLTAADVIHSWYVPSFFFKRDAVPGRVNEFEITIEKPGVYGGQCAEFCGLAHGDMFFSVEAVSLERFDEWMANGGTFPEGSEATTESEPATDETTTDETTTDESTMDETTEEAA